VTRLAIKYGDIEIEYDGPEEFLKNELAGLIKAVASLAAPPAAKLPGGAGTGDVGQPADEKMSVSTIAQKLSVSNGPDLIAAAALSLVSGGNGAFTKRQLRDRIREATTFFRSTYANNFDNYVKVLVRKGRLNHTGADNYSLPDKERVALNSRIGAADA
jgi:hypothetical protein